MKILMVFGTRPEAIKMAPLYQAFTGGGFCEVKVCVTAQHREMLDQVMGLFAIKPDFDLDLMRPNQTLSSLTAAMISGLDQVIGLYKPDWIFVHGDTTTSMVSALVAYYHKVKIAHIEAGLRTFNIYSPWPEEGNRQLTGRLADIHFAPTTAAEKNLLQEGVSKEKIYVTGNTVVDALLAVSGILERDEKLSSLVEDKFFYLNSAKKLILVTGHRRENFGKRFEEVCGALNDIAERGDVEIVYPVHLNPNVREPVNRLLRDKLNVHLIEPQEYLPFIYLMKRAFLILTDSGGVQEEAPSLKTPVLVMRDTTERPEALEAGVIKLVGSNRVKIYEEVVALIENNDLYRMMASGNNPYGDGMASVRIAEYFKKNVAKI